MSTYVATEYIDFEIRRIDVRESVERLPLETLTEREWKVLLARLQGATHREAAEAAGLSSASSAHHALERALARLREADSLQE